MSDTWLIVRETAISVLINTAISVGFFLLVFSFGPPVATRALAPDFLPQTFMVALMGSLVPALLIRRRSGAPVAAIVRRTLLIAFAALVVAGGGAFAVTHASDVMLASSTALAIKAAFGAVLAAIVTPLAVAATLRYRPGGTP